MVILLTDLEENTADAVIVTETTTAEQINDIINKVKFDLESEWQFDDIVNNLPKDCKVYSRWSGNIETVYY